MSFQLKLGLVGGLLVMAAIFLFRTMGPSSLPPLDRDLHAHLGRVMANEVSSQLGGEGTVVVVLPEASFDMPLVDSQFHAFQKALNGKGKLRIIDEEKIRLDRMGPLDGLLTPDLYQEFVEKHKQAGAIVSFVGLGNFNKAQTKKLVTDGPALFVISPNVAIPWPLIESQFVAGAIVPRLNAVSSSDSASEDARFNRTYEVVAFNKGTER